MKDEGLMVFQMHIHSLRANGSCRMFSLTVLRFSGCFSLLICSILENFKPNHLFWSAVLLSGQQIFFVVFLILEFAYFLLIIPRCFVCPPHLIFSHFSNCASPRRTAGRFFLPLDHPAQLSPKILPLLFAHLSVDLGQSPWRIWGVGEDGRQYFYL